MANNIGGIAPISGFARGTKARDFGLYIEDNNHFQGLCLNVNQGLGLLTGPLVRAYRPPKGQPVRMVPGNIFLVFACSMSFPPDPEVLYLHEIPQFLPAVNPDDAGDVDFNQLADYLAVYILEVISFSPGDEANPAPLVQVKLISKEPPRAAADPAGMNLIIPVKPDNECSTDMTFSFKWIQEDGLQLVITATDALLEGLNKPTTREAVVGNAPPPRSTASIAATTLSASGKATVINDCDGKPLLMLNKTEYLKEEKKSRGMRRAMGSSRLRDLLGDRGYVRDDILIANLLRTAHDKLVPWRNERDYKVRVKDLPAVTTKFSKLLSFEEDVHDDGSDTFDMRDFLLAGDRATHSDSSNGLRIALENMGLVMAYVFDDAFVNVSLDARTLIDGGTLEYQDPKHLWYAAKRVWSRFCQLMQTDQETDLDSYWRSGNPQGSAAIASGILKTLLAELFNPVKIKEIRDSWDSIIRTKKAAIQFKTPKASDVSTPTDGAKRKASEDKANGAEGAKAPKAPKPEPTAESRAARMCTTHAKAELEVSGAKPCPKKDLCEWKHYDLASMSKSEAAAMIKAHGSTSQKGNLYTWARDYAAKHNKT